jgi:hypothetical protein
VAAGAFVLGGALAMLAGWLGVSRSAYPAKSLPYIISGGFFGLLLVGAGAVLWLSADLRDEWRKLDSIEQAWRDAEARPVTTLASKAGDEGSRASVAR